MWVALGSVPKAVPAQTGQCWATATRLRYAYHSLCEQKSALAFPPAASRARPCRRANVDSRSVQRSLSANTTHPATQYGLRRSSHIETPPRLNSGFHVNKADPHRTAFLAYRGRAALAMRSGFPATRLVSADRNPANDGVTAPRRADGCPRGASHPA